MVPSLSTVPAVMALPLVWTVEPAGMVLVFDFEPKVPESSVSTGKPAGSVSVPGT